MATWLSWSEAEVRTVVSGNPLQAVSIWSLYPIQVFFVTLRVLLCAHITASLCYDAVLKGKQTIFLTLFDLTAKLTKTKSVYSLIDYYAKIPVLCLDELGYVITFTRTRRLSLPDYLKERTETGTTIVTTNLVPSQWGKVFDSVTVSAILDRLKIIKNLVDL